MRTLLLSVVVLLFCGGTVSAQAELIAHWPLDGTTQEVINNLHGIPSATGVSWVTDDPQRGKVMLLDGVTGFVTLPSEIWTVPEDTNTAITLWYNFAGGAKWQRVYSFGRAEQYSPPWAVHYYCPADNDSIVRVTTLGYLQEWQDFRFDTLKTNQWYFTAVIFKGDSLKIWLNNELILAHDSVPTTPQEFQTGDSSINLIGKSHWAADKTFNGMIDDFRVYGDALTDEEVLALFEEGNVSVPKVKQEADINLYGLDGKIMYSPINENSVRSVSVYGITGSLLFRSDRISDLQYTKFIPGIYIVRMSKDGAFLSKKVVIAN